MADSIIGFAVKGIAGGIGLASESIKARKNNKRANLHTREAGTDSAADQRHSYSVDEALPFEENDANLRALDEAQDELLPAYSTLATPGCPEKQIRDVKILIDDFFAKHSLPNLTDLPPVPRLPYPVVLPQRRPENRSRGFIRAYAPILMNAGIDQASFLDYVELFDKASQASPWLNAINLAGFAFSFLPSGISMAISVAIAISVKVAMEMQSRSRTNTFLDRLNAELFLPRGLICLVLTWNPESADTHSNVNLTSALKSSSSTPSSAFQKLRHRLQSSSGNTYGELELPETAPLMFPALEHLVTQDDEQTLKTKDKLKKKGEFVASYMDRRAQAKYAGENPGSMLVKGPKPEFTSRYADPNHPASSGNLISLVTGGYVNPPSLGDLMSQGQRKIGGLGRSGGGTESRRGMANNQSQTGVGRSRGALGTREETTTSSNTLRSVDGREKQQIYTPEALGSGLGGINAPDLLKKGVKKVLGKNILYMMIVNMPSEEEMVLATEQADAAEREARRQM